MQAPLHVSGHRLSLSVGDWQADNRQASLVYNVEYENTATISCDQLHASPTNARSWPWIVKRTISPINYNYS